MVEILGHINDPGVDIMSIVRNFDLPEVFPEKVMNQAERYAPEVTEADREGRLDLRDLTMVTIDGEDAKDLDDAVSLTREGGNYCLGVHIADVSNYVQENSALDREALKRGTSVYLVDRVIPMLPHALSNGICSLNAGEDRLAGISFCAVCDGAFYAGQDVAVAGGGSTALQDALYLADICRHVTVIHRRSDFRADPILVERAEKTANLTLLRSTVVEALEGSERLTGLTLRNTAVGEVSHLPVSALFQAVGLLPESRLARSLGVPVDEAGFIAAGEDCLTPIPGIFAAGDLRAKEVRQLTTACADGAVAALAACRFCV